MRAHRFRNFRQLPVRAIEVPRRRLEQIRNMPGVRMVIEDKPIELMSLSSREAARIPSGSTFNSTLTGAGVTVAVIDSGVDVHQDMPSFKQYSFLDGNYPTLEIVGGEVAPWDDSHETPVDTWGHGTHVAGIIVGAGDGSNGDARGVAPDAEIISLRVLNEHGQGNASDLVAALDWVLEYKDVLGIDVVNMSLGMAVLQPAELDPLVQAAEAAWDAGIVVLSAAGNLGWSGNFTIHSPGNSRKLITVGSLTDAARRSGGERRDDGGSDDGVEHIRVT